MSRNVLVSLYLSTVLAISFSPGEEKGPESPKDRYADLFSVPSKVALDDSQKEKLAELRKEYEKRVSDLDKALDRYVKTVTGKGDPEWYSGLSQTREKLARLVVRKKHAILSEEQRTLLGVKAPIPSILQKKALNDEKVWDLSKLENLFIIQSTSFDPEEQALSFMVLTRRKWTDKERASDATDWGGTTYYESPIQVIFYTKTDEKILILTGPYVKRIRGNPTGDGGISRVPTKLTDKQVEEGLLRFRITLDLDPPHVWKAAMKATSVTFVYPEPK
ncbi:MAG: hypothetical protein U0793_31090 [Gemmataceae bacterium]